MDFLGLTDKCIVVMGVANRRSVATAAAAVLREAGANVIFTFKDQTLLDKNRQMLGGDDIHAVTCDVSNERDLADLPAKLATFTPRIDGLLHSLAFAPYSDGMQPFHSTPRADFLTAIDISCYSLIAVCNQLKAMFSSDASVVTMSISTTRMASESYGYMGPVKAALDSSVVFLAKSLSKVSSRIRVNAVGASPLKTSASAGIPGYVDSYLYAEKATLRHQGVQTQEVGNAIAFLLSPRSSGINAQTIIVDAGMSCNYFDELLINNNK